jgi:hypothetical protein
MGSAVSARQTSDKTKGSSDAKIDLNTATEKDLDSLPGVGPATAKKIIAGRPYSSVDDLSKAGLSARTITKVSPLVTVSGATAAATTKPSAKVSAKETPPVSPSSAPPSQPPAAAPSQPPPPPPSKATSSAAPQGTPGAGMVWVNLETGVYHYQNSRYYGKTKSGKYLSEADAVKAGYRPAKNEKKP